MATSSSKNQEKPKADNRAAGSFGFLSRLLDIFAGASDPDREKKRLLKEVEKQLKKHRFKFYKPKTGEVQPALARYFYDIYKSIAYAQNLVEHAEASRVLKSIVIEHFLNDRQKEIESHFDEEVIKKRSQEISMKELTAEYKEHVISFFSSFNTDTVSKINATYNLLDVFLQVIHFDYYFLIKKFDSRIAETDFKYKPRFEAINGEYISDDLKDFMEIVPLVDERYDWQSIFQILQVYKNTEVVSASQWKTVLRNISELRKSGILTLMIRHIDGDPHYKPVFSPPKHKIVEEYLAKLKAQIEMTVQKVINESRKNTISDLATRVFGTEAVSRTRNYTDKANITFSKKMLGGYVYVAPLNYLKAFLLDYLKGEIKATVDLLLVRGQWSAPILSQQLSEPYHKLVELTDELLEFDSSLADDGERGALLRSALNKSEKDKGMVRVLKQRLSDVNGEALRIIKESAQYLVSLAKYLKALLDDRKAKPPEMILNWREVESASETGIDQSLSSIYKKIYYFSQLMQYYLRS